MYRILAFLALAISGPVQAQHSHNNRLPTEAGQSAFAALAEIVDLLRANPHTDWDSVNVPALQEHLVDMEFLATGSVSKSEVVDGRVRFEVSGDPRVVEALHRMVPAHAPFLDAETGWATEVETQADGVVVEVTGDEHVIAALGFHGLMTIGAHHQEHHIGIATGQMVHD